MKILVTGAGSIARRHLTNLRKLLPAARVAVLRRQPISEGLEPFGVETITTSLDEAVAWAPDAAIIASPSPLHMDSGLILARANAHLMVEKPFSDSMTGVDDLIAECHR